jgi:drug/metabolite transporter (DMT)-like permease/GNAT superfamily N-acetyltransferase
MASALAAGDVDLRHVSTTDPAAVALLSAYADELEERQVDREGCRIDTVPSEYEHPHGAFLVMYADNGRPIGCGGIRELGEGVAELKRMYVAPEARGNGYGGGLLVALEDEARRLGYERLRLDTAERLREAQALYRGAGYTEIPDYNGNTAAALWFEKDLAKADGDAAPPSWLVWLALAAIYLIWGSTYLAIRVMVETVPPLLGAGVRFLLAGLIFYSVLRLRRGAAAVRFSRANLLAAAGAGTLLCFGGNGLVTVAEQHVPSGIAAVVIASVPLWIVLFRKLSHESINRVALVGVLIGFVGVAILLVPGQRPAGASIGGMLLIVVAAACWAIGSYYPRRWPMPADAMLSTALQMITAGAVMVVVGSAVGELGDVHVSEFSTKSIAGFVWLVTAGSLVAFTAYVWLLKNAPISKVATYAYVNPVVAIFLGWALLSEKITSTVVIGASLIIASVALVVSRESG